MTAKRINEGDMKRLAAIVGFSIFCLWMNVWAADEPVSFSGTYIIDNAKSDAVARMVMGPGNSGVGDVSRGGGGFGGGFGGGMPGGGFGGGMPGGGMPGGGMGGPGGAGAGKGPQAPQNPSPLTIEQTESEMKITSIMKGMDGKEAPIIENYTLDEKKLEEMVQAPFSTEKVKKTTKAKLKKNKFRVDIVTAGVPPQPQTSLKKEYELSKDGKTLTLEVSNDMGMFQSIQKLVYNKQ
jgi:hypothetical protein